MRIVELEHEADAVTTEVHHLLDRTFLPKIDRPDVEHLIACLDDITDGLHDAAYLVDIFELDEPNRDAVEIIDCIRMMVKHLNDLLSAFPRVSLEVAQTAHRNIDHWETVADEKWRAAVKKIYRELSTKEYLAWKAIFDALEKVSDRCLASMHVIDSVVRKSEQ